MSNKYQNFTSLDFAQDPWFIKWIRTGDEEAAHYWENWIRQHPEKEPEVEEARKLVMAIRVKEEEPSNRQVRELWDRIDDQTTRGRQSKRLPVVRWIGYAAAACAAVLVFFYFYDPAITLTTGNGEYLTHYLPDSSVVRLNAASSVTYKSGTWETNRTIELKGEAFFEVHRGSPFSVSTPSGQVEVLGTSFNVKAREEQLGVDCFTGRVQVNSYSGSSRTLAAGESTKLQEGGNLSSPEKFDPDRTAGWRDGRFYFQQASLGQVAEELERQFDITIQADPEILQRTGNFFFETANLDTALYKVTWPMGLEIEKKRDVVIFIEE